MSYNGSRYVKQMMGRFLKFFTKKPKDGVRERETPRDEGRSVMLICEVENGKIIRPQVVERPLLVSVQLQ